MQHNTYQNQEQTGPPTAPKQATPTTEEPSKRMMSEHFESMLTAKALFTAACKLACLLRSSEAKTFLRTFDQFSRFAHT